MNDELRIQIFDMVYVQGPLAPQYIAAELGVYPSAVSSAIRHPWFYVQNYRVHIAIKQSTHPMIKP